MEIIFDILQSFSTSSPKQNICLDINTVKFSLQLELTVDRTSNNRLSHFSH